MSSERAAQGPSAGMVDTKLEVVVVPVADVDRAKRFYGSLGWRVDADFSKGEDWRAVQVTPPGSACSVIFGKGVTTDSPGSLQGLLLIVDDVAAARAELIGRGVDVSEVFHFENGLRFTGTKGRAAGPDPQGASYRSWASFSDPDGNGWLLQEVKTRLPGRGFGRELATLTELLREAEEHHGAYEASAPKHHWSGWYAAYIIARERGKTPEEAAKDAGLHMAATRHRGPRDATRHRPRRGLSRLRAARPPRQTPVALAVAARRSARAVALPRRLLPQGRISTSRTRPIRITTR